MSIYVLSFVPAYHSKDKEQLSRLLESEPQFRSQDVEAAVVISTVTNSGLKELSVETIKAWERKREES